MFNPYYFYEPYYKGSLCYNIPNIDGLWDLIGITMRRKYITNTNILK